MEQPKVSGRVKHKKRLLIVIIVAVVALAIAGGVIWFLMHRTDADVATYGCSETALKSAGQNLVYPIDKAKLAADAATIRKSPSYAKSADCTFVTTFYELNYGSLANAKQELAKLKAAFDPAKGYGPLVSQYASSPTELESQINDASTAMENIGESQQTGPFTPATGAEQ